jgi:hypothetical protein
MVLVRVKVAEDQPHREEHVPRWQIGDRWSLWAEGVQDYNTESLTLTCLERHTPWTPNTPFVDFEKSCRYKTLHFSSLHFQWPLTRLIDFFPYSYIVFIYYWIFCGPEYSLYYYILLAGRSNNQAINRMVEGI